MPCWRSGQVLEGIEVEGCVKEPLQLCQVGFLIASGRGSCWLPPCIPARRRWAVRRVCTDQFPPSPTASPCILTRQALHG